MLGSARGLVRGVTTFKPCGDIKGVFGAAIFTAAGLDGTNPTVGRCTKESGAWPTIPAEEGPLSGGMWMDEGGPLSGGMWMDNVLCMPHVGRWTLLDADGKPILDIHANRCDS